MKNSGGRARCVSYLTIPALPTPIVKEGMAQKRQGLASAQAPRLRSRIAGRQARGSEAIWCR